MVKSTIIRLCGSRRPQLILLLMPNHVLSGCANDLTLINNSLHASLWHLVSSRRFREGSEIVKVVSGVYVVFINKQLPLELFKGLFLFGTWFLSFFLILLAFAAGSLLLCLHWIMIRYLRIF